ncbi:MAG: MBL fold metallo-hydrolase [Paludibacteraceae bacterium]|nr:MBL fold metallo-hydrolase [Paludibacteraceae bacterium]
MKIKQIQNNPFQENTYIVWDETSMEAAIVDCGALFPQEEERIEAFISDNNLKVKYILNTHLHLDHCFGNAWAVERYGVLPMAHEDDETLLARMGEQARMFGLPFEVKTEKLGGYLKDGDVLTLGENRIEVIHTPGHSRGGLCFYIPSAGWLVSGDSLFEGSIGRTDLEGGSYATLIKSITERLMTLPEETVVYPGHGPYTTIGDEKRSNPFL